MIESLGAKAENSPAEVHVRLYCWPKTTTDVRLFQSQSCNSAQMPLTFLRAARALLSLGIGELQLRPSLHHVFLVAEAPAFTDDGAPVSAAWHPACASSTGSISIVCCVMLIQWRRCQDALHLVHAISSYGLRRRTGQIYGESSVSRHAETTRVIHAFIYKSVCLHTFMLEFFEAK